MKNQYLVSLFIVFLFCSCGNDEQNEKHLSLKYNGVYWEADTSVMNANYIPSGNYLLVNGSSVAESVSIQVMDVTGPGTYEIKDTAANYSETVMFHSATFSYNSHPLGYGYLTLEDLGPLQNSIQKAKGTFYGVLYQSAGDSLIITEGSFNGGI